MTTPQGVEALAEAMRDAFLDAGTPAFFPAHPTALPAVSVHTALGLVDRLVASVVPASPVQPEPQPAALTDDDWQAIADDAGSIVWSHIRQAVDRRLAAITMAKADPRAELIEQTARWLEQHTLEHAHPVELATELRKAWGTWR